MVDGLVGCGDSNTTETVMPTHVFLALSLGVGAGFPVGIFISLLTNNN